MTTTAAAAALGVNAMTIRRWCAAHAKHLSAAANPPSNATRKLTGRDLEVLRAVDELRDQGITGSQVNARLAAMTFPEIDEDSQQDAQDGPGAQEADREGQYTALVRLSVLEAVYSADRERWDERERDYQARIEALAQQVGQLQGQRTRPGWWVKLFGGEGKGSGS